MNNVESVTFKAKDGYSLAGRLYIPSKTPHAVLLINSGTGIPQGFYSRFAHYASEKGFVVLTFDYRGIGESAPESLKGFKALYREWGQLDVAAAINWLKTTHPNLPLTVVGHSTGGQQLGLAYNADEVSAAIFVSVSTGYWKGMLPSQKWRSLGLWKLYIPSVTRLLNYAAVKKIGLGENLPSGVALEWGSWCLEPTYLAAFFDETEYKKSIDGAPFGAIHFEDLRCPVKAYCFTDDEIATKLNVPPLQNLFKSANIVTKWIKPSELGKKYIGHFGYFRSGVEESLWSESIKWLNEQIG
jgi:predicted alpha/beta hydrolase